MELLKIEEYSNALKVFLRPTEYYPEGQNFFYCDVQFKNAIRDAVILDFTSREDGNRYAMINGIALHRFVMMSSGRGDVVDHISGVTYDNCSCNLRITDSRGNANNKYNLGVSYNKNKGVFSIRTRCGTYPETFTNEVDALIARSYIIKLERELGNGVGYNFLYDRRDDADLVDLVRTDQLSVEDELNTYLKRYSSNTWCYYRHYIDLLPYKDLFVTDYLLDDQGFLCDSYGCVLSPLHYGVDLNSKRYKQLEEEEAELAKQLVFLERKKNILKKQEERLDEDIHACELDRDAFSKKFGVITLEQLETKALLGSDVELGKYVRGLMVANKMKVTTEDLAMLVRDEDFSLF